MGDARKLVFTFKKLNLILTFNILMKIKQASPCRNLNEVRMCSQWDCTGLNNSVIQKDLYPSRSYQNI